MALNTPIRTAMAAVLVCLAAATTRAAEPIPTQTTTQPGTQEPTPLPTPAPAPPSVPTGLVPPKPTRPIAVPYPADAPALTEPVVVTAKLVIDPSGHVTKVEIVSAGTPAAGDAVARAASAFEFSPATLDGQPVAVEIAFTHTFLPPERPPDPHADPQSGPDTQPKLDAALRGRLRERGTHAPIAGASVAVVVDGVTYATLSGPDGRFRLPAPAGNARVFVRANGYHDFLQKEALAPGEELVVGYFVDADHYDPYEIVVHGGAKREEVSRIALSGHEAKQVPGTLGDPFRVIQSLPGVASIMSLLPFPIVRGTSPGSTGFLIDGVRVPLLYHLMAGPSVVHPNFIEEVLFYPGGFPAPLGGYTAGIVDGHTRRAAADEHVIDIDLNLTQAGAFVRQPILGTSLSVAGRYGYPGLLLSAISDGEISLSYWDYQLRFDAGTPRQGLTVFAYGAGDTLKERDAVMKENINEETGAVEPTVTDVPHHMVTVLDFMFHRIDIRYLQATGPVDGSYRLVLGYDETLASADAAFRTFGIENINRWKLQASECLALAAGLDVGYRDSRAFDAVETDESPVDVDLSDLTPGPHHVSGAAFVEGLWHPVPELLIRPGVRVDGRWDGETSAWTVDPRLILRYRLADSVALEDPAEATDADAVWLKASIGLYHQPPRLPAPLPGIDELPLRFGELASIQASLGIELPFAREWQLDAEAYYNALDPVVFDLAVNDVPGDASTTSATIPSDEGDTTSDLFDSFVKRQVGRAFGLELMLRKRDTGRGLHGWLAYTLSRSERRRDRVWVPFDYDRTHLVSLVLGWTLPRNWEFSVRLQYQSGRAQTTSAGYNTGRDDGYVRVDVRVDKHAVWNHWLLDFYVDLTNAALLPEQVGPDSVLRYVLPTFGVRGRL